MSTSQEKAKKILMRLSPVIIAVLTIVWLEENPKYIDKIMEIINKQFQSTPSTTEELSLFPQKSESQEETRTNLREKAVTTGLPFPTSQQMSHKSIKEQYLEAKLKYLTRIEGNFVRSTELPYAYLVPVPLPKIAGNRITKLNRGVWKQKAKDKFPWQRYKTIKEMRNYVKSAKGVSIALEYLSDDQFWTRMEAALTLTSWEYDISYLELKNIFENTSTSLITNYFKKLRSKPSTSALTLMKKSLLVVPVRAREEILVGISKAKDDEKIHYLVAALFDPEIRIQSLALAKLKKLNLQGYQVKEFQQNFSEKGHL